MTRRPAVLKPPRADFSNRKRTISIVSVKPHRSLESGDHGDLGHLLVSAQHLRAPPTPALTTGEQVPGEERRLSLGKRTCRSQSTWGWNTLGSGAAGVLPRHSRHPCRDSAFMRPRVRAPNSVPPPAGGPAASSQKGRVLLFFFFFLFPIRQLLPGGNLRSGEDSPSWAPEVQAGSLKPLARLGSGDGQQLGWWGDSSSWREVMGGGDAEHQAGL